ncbi:hypothetical protein K443DRAFT_104355, partial [Laccaria amethystina LaAM-08-1]
TVETLITHAFRWTVQAMGFQRLWVAGVTEILGKSYFLCYDRSAQLEGKQSGPFGWGLKPMGFTCQGLWVTGYRRLMGYGGLQTLAHHYAHQLGGPKKAWDFRGYGLSEAWVTRVLTVPVLGFSWKLIRKGKECIKKGFPCISEA